MRIKPGRKDESSRLQQAADLVESPIKGGAHHIIVRSCSQRDISGRSLPGAVSDLVGATGSGKGGIAVNRDITHVISIKEHLLGSIAVERPKIRNHHWSTPTSRHNLGRQGGGVKETVARRPITVRVVRRWPCHDERPRDATIDQVERGLHRKTRRRHRCVKRAR